MKSLLYLGVRMLMALVLAMAGSAAFAQSLVTNSYTVSDEDFANPERGFYLHTENWSSSPSTVPGNLTSLRVNGSSAPNNTYSARISLALRMFYLDSFVNTPISSNYLNAIQTDFNSLRVQGFKAVIRFAYNTDDEAPFDEPSKARILAHIEQLKPLLIKNRDVIAVLQQGFIGAWGEGYYTSIFYTNGLATAQHWTNRAEVLNALLAALPSERMIQVRVPQLKQKFVYSPAAPVTSAALSPTNVLNGSGAARIGFHNDCFLASSTDYGTFANYDSSGGNPSQANTALRNYLALETRYAPMGGETCAEYPPKDDCAAAGGQADLEMALFHYSFLNQSYHANVNDDWVTQGCIGDIKRRLGYRLQLVSGIFRTEAQTGQTIPLTLEFQNVGFAAPFNPRGLELVLRNIVTGQKYFAELSRDTDARRWLPGTNYVCSPLLSLPQDMPLGSYELFLHLPDPQPSLYGVIPYSIRLANSNAVSSAGAVIGNIWDSATGYNRLGVTLTVNNTASNPSGDRTEIPVLNFSAVRETYDNWKARNFSSNSIAGAPDADPDADGRPNLLEYAVGSNPNAGGDGDYIETSLESSTLLLTVRKGPGAKDGHYEVESSTNLAPNSWSNSQVTILDDNAGFFRARYDAANASGFLRLKVTLAE